MELVFTLNAILEPKVPLAVAIALADEELLNVTLPAARTNPLFE